MGLLSSYGSFNRVLLQDKTVTYNKVRVYGSWSYASGTSIVTLNSVFEYHRYAKMTYKYVGMDLTTAQSCASALITLFTRQTKISDWTNNGFVTIDGGTICMADIAILKTAGHMYEVVCAVREDDTRMDITGSPSAASLFTIENQRTYYLT